MTSRRRSRRPTSTCCSAAPCRRASSSLWKVGTGDLLASMDAGHLRAIDSSPDGRTVVTRGDEQAPLLWEIPTGRRLAILEGCPDGAGAYAFSPDGKRIVTGDKDNIRFY